MAVSGDSSCKCYHAQSFVIRRRFVNKINDGMMSPYNVTKHTVRDRVS
jgi:hypothetical protein